MRTQREVFNKLFKEDKTELAAEKVDLSIDAEIKRAENIVNAMIVTAKAFEKEIQSADKKINEIIFMLDTNGLDNAYINPAKKIHKYL